MASRVPHFSSLNPRVWVSLQGGCRGYLIDHQARLCNGSRSTIEYLLRHHHLPCLKSSMACVKWYKGRRNPHRHKTSSQDRKKKESYSIRVTEFPRNAWGFQRTRDQALNNRGTAGLFILPRPPLSSANLGGGNLQTTGHLFVSTDVSFSKDAESRLTELRTSCPDESAGE